MHARKIEGNISILQVRSFTFQKVFFCIYFVIELSQLMLNLDVVIARSFLCRALAMHSLWEYYDLYGLFQRRLNLEKLTMAT